MPRGRSPQTLLDLFAARTVVDLATIQEVLGGVTPMTAFRYLRQVPYRRSYNHNGRYYTLHDPGRYDGSGLWSRGSIHFSVDGSLRNTVRRVVHEADAGATHRELADRLRVRVHNTLLDLLRKREVDREEIAAMYVYLHIDAAVKEGQLQRRRALIEAAEAEVTHEVAIQVLLAVIRHPGSGPADVARRLQGLSPPIGIAQVSAVFARYDLGEKRGPSTC